MPDKKIVIKIQAGKLREPVNQTIVSKVEAILNIVFNTSDFEEQLCKQTFVASNRPDMSNNGRDISGKDVFNDFISKGTINISVTVKLLTNPWRRWVSRTMGETNPNGNSIITYHWWLDDSSEKKLVIAYATHIGHEIFHTKYFGYIHDPGYGTRHFVNERDVTYMIDDILESLIKKYYQ